MWQVNHARVVPTIAYRHSNQGERSQSRQHEIQRKKRKRFELVEFYYNFIFIELILISFHFRKPSPKLNQKQLRTASATSKAAAKSVAKSAAKSRRAAKTTYETILNIFNSLGFQNNLISETQAQNRRVLQQR